MVDAVDEEHELLLPAPARFPVEEVAVHHILGQGPDDREAQRDHEGEPLPGGAGGPVAQAFEGEQSGDGQPDDGHDLHGSVGEFFQKIPAEQTERGTVDRQRLLLPHHL